LVELQHFRRRTLEELDLETWYQLERQPIEDRKTGAARLDVGEVDDLTGTEVTDTLPKTGPSRSKEIVKPQERPMEESSEEEEDDWGEATRQKSPWSRSRARKNEEE